MLFLKFIFIVGFPIRETVLNNIIQRVYCRRFKKIAIRRSFVIHFTSLLRTQLNKIQKIIIFKKLNTVFILCIWDYYERSHCALLFQNKILSQILSVFSFVSPDGKTQKAYTLYPNGKGYVVSLVINVKTYKVLSHPLNSEQ